MEKETLQKMLQKMTDEMMTEYDVRHKEAASYLRKAADLLRVSKADETANYLIFMAEGIETPMREVLKSLGVDTPEKLAAVAVSTHIHDELNKCQNENVH